MPDPAAADLFRKGRELIQQGQFKQGCERFRASYARFPAASSALNIAQHCEEREGRVASAWALYERALVLNRETPGLARRQALEKIAREGVKRLEARLPRLQVKLHGAPAGAVILQSGSVLPQGEAVPLDPGAHEIEVRAPGFQTARKQITLREGEQALLEFELQPNPPAVAPAAPPLEVSSLAPEASAKPQEGPVVSSGPDRTQPEAGEAASSRVPTWAWVSGGAGVLLTAAGTVFLVDALAARSDLEATCGADLVCDEAPGFDPEPLNSRRDRGIGLAIGLGSAGVVALVISAIGIAQSGSAPEARAARPRVNVSRTEHGWYSSVSLGF